MPYQAVKAWWDSLTPEQRRAEALNLLGEPDVFRSWDAEWDQLSPYSQHTKLFAYYRGMLGQLKPIHGPGAAVSFPAASPEKDSQPTE